MPAAEELASLIRERGPAVVLSGAGMSTESGIPDFRSAGGLWDQVDPYEVASIDAFRRDPLHVWRWYGPRVAMLAAAEPNEGHLALAELERDGHVTAVATQNIDALHTRAGSADVLELHGSIRRFDCLACGADETLPAVLAQLGDREAPVCAACGSILKPGVVMFGELLPV
ncbi:MAG TPA: Sir2 family NAD-dependent protein deacetylase, partial [Gaiella sp.]|nr:Sir2 family NAD-dependent protein deacetylase [Gaiella sp.]